MEQPKINPEIEQQRQKVMELYDHIAGVYDKDFEAKAEYQAPRILTELYAKYGITGGEVLDIGSGTGKLKEYLGDGFSYTGIDISSAMIEEAKKRSYTGHVGAAEEVIKSLGDKSVDHVTALSSLYFVEDFDTVLQHAERVARQSIFFTLEQFTPEVIEMMKDRGIQLYNHPLSKIENPTEVIQNTYLWKRPNTEDKIYGDIVFKKLE
jgi:ubiquinone/menaquinone biosynthesis C-methylase UbiE